MRCPDCQHENPAAANFCQECGAAFAFPCANCGVELPPTAKRLLSSGVPPSRRPASRTTTLDRVDERLDGPVEGGLIARFEVEGGDR